MITEVKDRIEQLRKEKGWSLAKMAREANLSPNAVYNWYNEKNYTPGRDAIDSLCLAFGISMSEFFYDVDVDRFTEKEMRLLDLYRKLSAAKQAVVLRFLELFTE